MCSVAREGIVRRGVGLFKPKLPPYWGAVHKERAKQAAQRIEIEFSGVLINSVAGKNGSRWRWIICWLYVVGNSRFLRGNPLLLLNKCQ